MNYFKSITILNFIFLLLCSCNNSENLKREQPISNKGISTELKIAYVDPEMVIPNMPEYKSAQEELEKLKNSLQQQMQVEQQRAQQYYTTVMNKVQQGILSPAQQKVEEDKLMKMQEDLQKKAMNMEEDLMKKEQEMTKPMYDKFNDALKEIAKSEGYSYVFDKKLLLYSEGGTDATEKLKEKLEIK